MKIYEWRPEANAHRLYIDSTRTEFVIRRHDAIRARNSGGKKRFEALNGKALIRGNNGYVRTWMDLSTAKARVEYLAGMRKGEGVRKLQNLDDAPVASRSVTARELRAVGGWVP